MIHEATRSGFVRAIWCGFVDRSGLIRKNTRNKTKTQVPQGFSSLALINSDRMRAGKAGGSNIRLRDEFMFMRITASLILILSGSVSAMSPSAFEAKSCREHPQLIGKCFRVHGRLSTYNGNPAVRLWRIGTKRVLGVSDQRFSLPGYRNLPEDLSQKLNGENSIIGDFLACPFTPAKPREMQLVCIESAKNVVVKKKN